MNIIWMHPGGTVLLHAYLSPNIVFPQGEGKRAECINDENAKEKTVVAKREEHKSWQGQKKEKQKQEKEEEESSLLNKDFSQIF